MTKVTTGTVISAAKQWWLKVNTKAVRTLGSDGATYPYVIKVEYSVNATAYTKYKWLHAGNPVPSVGTAVKVSYEEDKPSKAKVLL